MYLGVDIGGTKTLVAVFNTDGDILETHKFPTPKDYEEFLKVLAGNVAELSTKDFQAAVAAVPGRLDRKTGTAIAFGNRPWTNLPIQADLEKITGCPVAIENDTKLAALSESKYITADYKKILYVTISTGISAGLIIDGKLDPNFADMEAGQLLLEHDGRLTDWEDFGSGRAFQKKFGKKVSELDPDDSAAWYYIARNIAIGLIDLIVTLIPDVIIIGGGVGSHFSKFSDRLSEELKIYENPMVAMPVIVPAKRPEEAVIYGCYELLKEKYGSRKNSEDHLSRGATEHVVSDSNIKQHKTVK